MQANTKRVLKRFEIYSSLSDRELERLEPFLYRRKYRKKQILFTEGDPREKIYLLLDGFIKLERTNYTATLMYNDFVKKYTIFPYGGMFSDETYHYNAIALTNVDLYYIPTQYFEEFVKKDINQLVHIIQTLSHILELHEKRLQTIANPHATERVIQTLGNLMNDLGDQNGNESVIDCPITIMDIAKISGTSRETVSHVIKDLRKENLLTIDQKKIIIHDVNYFNNI